MESDGLAPRIRNLGTRR